MVVSIPALKEREKKKHLEKAKMLLKIAGVVGADLSIIKEDMKIILEEVHTTQELIAKVDEIIDMTIEIIINTITEDLSRHDLDPEDVEDYFLKARVELKKSSLEGARNAQRLLKEARTKAQELKAKRDKVEEMITGIKEVLKEVQGQNISGSALDEYETIIMLLKSTVQLSTAGEFETAELFGEETIKRANKLRDLRPRSIRYSAKAGHIVGRVKVDGIGNASERDLVILNTLLATIKYMLEREEYHTAFLLAREVKREAEKLLPTDKTGVSSYACPICFGYICPNPYCNESIAPSPLSHETCRTYCQCGAFYHICCLQRDPKFLCVYCFESLM